MLGLKAPYELKIAAVHAIIVGRYDFSYLTRFDDASNHGEKSLVWHAISRGGLFGNLVDLPEAPVLWSNQSFGGRLNREAFLPWHLAGCRTDVRWNYMSNMVHIDALVLGTDFNNLLVEVFSLNRVDPDSKPEDPAHLATVGDSSGFVTLVYRASTACRPTQVKKGKTFFVTGVNSTSQHVRPDVP